MKKPSGVSTLGFLVSGVDRLILSQHQHCGAWNQALDLGTHLWITTASCTFEILSCYNPFMSGLSLYGCSQRISGIGGERFPLRK